MVYIGESGLTGYERCNQHYYDLLKKPDTSHMSIHLRDEHPELRAHEANFEFKVIDKIPRAFQRQI